MVLVPYANINNGIQDTMAGRAEVGIFSISVIEQHVQSGSVRALAIAADKRLDGAPDVPSAAETIPGFDFAGWFMLMAPAGTPPDIVKKLNAALDQALKDPQVREMAPKLGYELNKDGVGTPEEASAFLKAQLALWEITTKELGIEPE
jgi:tripartite-type tricarboxylate transporter receptor subunit TctC